MSVSSKQADRGRWRATDRCSRSSLSVYGRVTATLLEQLTPYFSYRDELVVHDGLIFKGERVIIPISLRRYMKEKIHSSHLGMERVDECRAVCWSPSVFSGMLYNTTLLLLLRFTRSTSWDFSLFIRAGFRCNGRWYFFHLGFHISKAIM